MYDEVLELETRRDIYDLILKFPGLHMREIQRKLKMSISLTEYHLNYLENAEIIISIVEESYRRYYIQSKNGVYYKDKIGYRERRILGVLRQRIPLQITLFLYKNKQATHSEISNNLNISPSKLSYHLKKLLRLGIIRKLGRVDGKGYIIENENVIFRLLITYKPSKDMLEEFSELWESIDL